MSRLYACKWCHRIVRAPCSTAEHSAVCEEPKAVLHGGDSTKRENEPAAPVDSSERRCTCHPDDQPPVPCPQKFAYSECMRAALGMATTELSRLTRDNATFRAAQKACETCDGPTMAEVATMSAEIDSLTRELEEATERSAIHDAIQRAARDLPDGFEVELSVERGSGFVVLRHPDGKLKAMDVDSDNRLAAEINAAIDTALSGGGGEG